jgi:hypothetical protein
LAASQAFWLDFLKTQLHRSTHHSAQYGFGLRSKAFDDSYRNGGAVFIEIWVMPIFFPISPFNISVISNLDYFRDC